MTDDELYEALIAIAKARWPKSDVHEGLQPTTLQSKRRAILNILTWLRDEIYE